MGSRSLFGPHSEQQFYIDFLPYERRAIRRDGIRMFNIFYWTDSLTILLHRSHNIYAVHSALPLSVLSRSRLDR